MLASNLNILIIGSTEMHERFPLCSPVTSVFTTLNFPYSSAITSISTSTSLGRRATSTVERAGGAELKYFP